MTEQCCLTSAIARQSQKLKSSRLLFLVNEEHRYSPEHDLAGMTDLTYIHPSIHDLAMKNTADMTGSKPIAI
jgi:hypothetical protein